MDAAVTRAEYEEHNKRMEDEHTRQNHRISALEKAVEQNNKLLVSVEKLAISMENMQKELTENGERLEVLEGRDGEMWRKAIGYIVTSIISIAVGVFFSRLGL
ncbi:MAG: hypothetical protein J6I97_00475 [Agathobacter sp.]|nr:hypothetical protein [Agathobacter sp.]